MSNAVLRLSLQGPKRGRHPPPAPGSIRATLNKSATPLFVDPLEWTADHLPALDVDLVISASLGELVAEDIKCQVDESKQLLGAAWDLEHARATSRDQQTRQLITRAAELQKLDIVESTLFFKYGNRHIAQLPPLILAWHQHKSTECSRTPIWAYTDHMWTSAARWKRYTSANKSWSFATKEIKSKQGLAIDPVYIAILITLAQLRRRHSLQVSKSHRVTLFVPEHESIVKTNTPQSNTTILEFPKDRRSSKRIVTRLAQYTADIPYAYLQKFEEPYKFFDASLHIEKKTLPTNEPAIIFQAMKTAFHDLGGHSKFSSPASTSKRKALGELDLNTEDQKRETKRRKAFRI